MCENGGVKVQNAEWIAPKAFGGGRRPVGRITPGLGVDLVDAVDGGSDEISGKWQTLNVPQVARFSRAAEKTAAVMTVFEFAWAWQKSTGAAPPTQGGRKAEATPNRAKQGQIKANKPNRGSVAVR